jgi:ABC-2 type transport system ATP-binding protein
MIRTENPEAILTAFGDACRRTENGSLMLKLASPAEKKELMKRLVEGYDIDEVKVFEPSLNDIFVEYAGDAPVEV